LLLPFTETVVPKINMAARLITVVVPGEIIADGETD
jgi:ribosomal 30S subunit maturation factor RimM